VYEKTKTEARQMLDALRQKNRLFGTIPERHPVGDLIQLWLDTGSARWKPRTLTNYRTDATILLNGLGRATLLSKLTTANIQSVLNRATSARRAQQLHQAIHAGLNFAVRWDWLVVYPADRAMRPVVRSKERQWWTGEQCRCFLTPTEQTAWWPLRAITLATGCRLAELTASKWTDVEWDSRVLRVDRTGQCVNRTWIETGPKTASGRRTLLLNDVAATALHRQRVQQVEWRLNAGEFWRDQGLVFSTHEGVPLRRFEVATALRNAVRQTLLPPATMHSLRHIAASLALDEGAPLPLVSRALGHANTGTTASIYSHAVASGQAVADALDRALGSQVH
jgi:integrase